MLQRIYVNVLPLSLQKVFMLKRHVLSVVTIGWRQKRWSVLICSEQLQQPVGRCQWPHFIQRQFDQVDR